MESRTCTLTLDGSGLVVKEALFSDDPFSLPCTLRAPVFFVAMIALRVMRTNRIHPNRRLSVPTRFRSPRVPADAGAGPRRSQHQALKALCDGAATCTSNR